MTKILFFGANPATTTVLGLGREVRQITKAIRQAKNGSMFELAQAWAVRIEDLQESLLFHEPDIVHFSGHGHADELYAETEGGDVDPIPPRGLAALFQIFSKTIRCVILNACYSGQQAIVLAEHIDCVIGMTHEVTDRAAITFAGSFYAALASGKSVKDAFALGCNQLEMSNIPGHDIPKLIARPGVRAEQIYLVDVRESTDVYANQLQAVTRVLLDAVATSGASQRLNAEEQRRVLRFVVKVVHVVEQALQEVYGLAIEVKHIQSGNVKEINRLLHELDLVLSRSAFSKTEEICSRLRNLRLLFESDVSLLLQCSQGDPRWYELFSLFEEHEGRIIRLVQRAISDLAKALETLRSPGVFGASKEKTKAYQTADNASRELLTSLRELRDLRDRILGLSGKVGFLELTDVAPDQFRHQANAIRQGFVPVK